jgi:4-hydroxythreonine-4-phosphate dehydrogenase
MSSPRRLPRIAVTAGDPAGIGPDIVLALATRPWPAQVVVLGDRELIAARAAALGIRVVVDDYAPDSPPAAGADSTVGHLCIWHHPLDAPCRTGHPDPANAAAILATLDNAAAACLDGRFDAMVTAPVSKAVIADSGVAFSGHTEYLRDRVQAKDVVMMLAAGDLRVALATTHLPLAEVPGAITRGRLRTCLEVLHADLARRFGLRDPRISVLGLNPHAGEQGHLGREEIETIIPLLDSLRDQGMRIAGPLPADTAFSAPRRGETDAYLAMYHDQGLPVLKFAGFGAAVNITLGLPIIRTSVDHGTAFELAGTGRAEAGSLLVAVEQALEMVANAL